MSYAVGVDLGTTYAAAAIARPGRAPEIVALGNRATVIPSVVFVAEDGPVLVGEAAERRASAQPNRVIREFKRLMGSPASIDRGGQSFTPQGLMVTLLEEVLRVVQEREGGTPDKVVLTYPANWSETKRDLLLNEVQTLGLPVQLLTEPEAAAISYAARERLDVGQIAAVYDLGGGTFDAAVLRRTTHSFEIVGRPTGIERLGGIDFDVAVMAHVDRHLGGAIDQADRRDALVAAGLARLRTDVVEAKEALSVEGDTTIPVFLPDLRTEVRLTRVEFEAMIRPVLTDTIGALRRALAAAEVTPADIAVVLLVGGSSRIPLVAQLVGTELGRPVAVDAHPKHAVALGAAGASGVRDRDARRTPPPVDHLADGNETEPSTEAPRREPVAAAAAEAAPATAGNAGSGSTAPARPATAPPWNETVRGKRLMWAGAAVAVIVASTVALVLALGGGGGGTEPGAAGSTPTLATATESVEPTTDPDAPTPGATVEAATPTTVQASTTGPTTTEPTTTGPTDPTTNVVVLPVGADQLPENCAGLRDPRVCITQISVDEEANLVALYEPVGFVPLVSTAPNQHVHFFFPVGEIADDPLNAGSSGSGSQGNWKLWDDEVFGPDGTRSHYTVADAVAVGATELCALVASAGHVVTLDSGNCIPLPAAALG